MSDKPMLEIVRHKQMYRDINTLQVRLVLSTKLLSLQT